MLWRRRPLRLQDALQLVYLLLVFSLELVHLLLRFQLQIVIPLLEVLSLFVHSVIRELLLRYPR